MDRGLDLREIEPRETRGVVPYGVRVLGGGRGAGKGVAESHHILLGQREGGAERLPGGERERNAGNGRGNPWCDGRVSSWLVSPSVVVLRRNPGEKHAEIRLSFLVCSRSGLPRCRTGTKRSIDYTPRHRASHRPRTPRFGGRPPGCCFWANAPSAAAHSGGNSRGRRSGPTATYVRLASVTLTQITLVGLRCA